MVWTPDFQLRANPWLAALILLLHCAVVTAVNQLGGTWWWLVPLVLMSGIWHLLQDGLRCLPWSVTRVWLDADGWHWQRRNGVTSGPCLLLSGSRVDARFIRLSLGRSPLAWPRYLLLTSGMIGADNFRQLQVFLRWAADKNQPLGT